MIRLLHLFWHAEPKMVRHFDLALAATSTMVRVLGHHHAVAPTLIMFLVSYWQC